MSSGYLNFLLSTSWGQTSRQGRCQVQNTKAPKLGGIFKPPSISHLPSERVSDDFGLPKLGMSLFNKKKV